MVGSDAGQARSAAARTGWHRWCAILIDPTFALPARIVQITADIKIDATKVKGHGYSLVGVRLCEIVNYKAGLHFDEMFFRGIFANFCVCVAVLIAYASRSPSGKIIGAIIPIMLFVVSGYEHSVANMALFAYSTMLDCPATKDINRAANGSFAHERYWANLFFSTMATSWARLSWRSRTSSSI